MEDGDMLNLNLCKCKTEFSFMKQLLDFERANLRRRITRNIRKNKIIFTGFDTENNLKVI